MSEQLGPVNNNEKVESRWWDPRRKGTLASFAAKTAIAGVMLSVVGNRLIDHSRGAVDTVVGNRTEQIRQDLKVPMDNVQQNAETAKKTVEDASRTVDEIDQNVGDLKKWFEDNMGVSFEVTPPTGE